MGNGGNPWESVRNDWERDVTIVLNMGSGVSHAKPLSFAIIAQRMVNGYHSDAQVLLWDCDYFQLTRRHYTSQQLMPLYVGVTLNRDAAPILM